MQGFHDDLRLVLRCERVTQDIVRSGCVVVHKLSGNRAAEIAAHRFLGSPGVTPDTILGETASRTARACRGRRIVVAQDTTDINFSGADRGRRGLGRAGDGKSLGFFIHGLVAVDAEDEAVLGMVGATIWTRGLDKVTDRQKRQLKAKESQRWIDGVATAGQVLGEAAGVVVVGDRESDIYQVFSNRPAEVDLVVRARGDRKLTDGKLFAAGDAFPVVHEMDVAVAPGQPRALGDRGRTARVAVSFGAVRVTKPRNSRASSGDPRQTDLHMVVVRERTPPSSGKPLVWRLLTTLPVTTLAEALEIVRLYRLRWRIEQVFRVLKRDGLALEETQIEGKERLFNLAALAIGAAARIIQLTDARDGSPRPATDVIKADEIDAVDAIGRTLEGKTQRQKNPHPRASLAWLSWIAARLGGWNCYYKPPGPKTFADGWRRLADRLTGFAIAQRALA